MNQCRGSAVNAESGRIVRYLRKPLGLAIFAMVLVCPTAGHAERKPKSISYEDATAFETALLSRPSEQVQPQKLFVQPSNKTEPCLLPTTQNQLEQPNFRAYWDGDCRTGYAYGLGRDIAISDVQHVEEIIIHNGTKDNWSGPRVDYDFVNGLVSYSVGGSQYPEGVSLVRKVDDSVSGFNLTTVVRMTDASWNSYLVETSPFSPKVIYTSVKNGGSVAYRFTDMRSVTFPDPNAVTYAGEVIDPRSKKSGVAVLIRTSGQVQHLVDSGAGPQNVLLPKNYLEHLTAESRKIVSYVSGVQLQQAQQIERAYLYKVCSDNTASTSIPGLDRARYTKICTWWDKYRQPYAAAEQRYAAQLASLRERVATAEQQRQVQRQIDLQQRMARRQIEQQGWDELSRSSQQLQQQTQQILQQAQDYRPPVFQPLTPPGGNKVICNTVGSMTICR